MGKYKISSQKILELTNGGLDVILQMYPDADKKGGRWQKISLRFEKDDTPSTCIDKDTIGKDQVKIHSFSSGRRFNCFDLVMEEHSLDFYEACVHIVKMMNLQIDENTNFGQGGFEMKEAEKNQKDGDYIFEYHEKLTKFELDTLGPLVTNDVVDRFNTGEVKLKSCKSFTQIKTYSKDLKDHKSDKTHQYAGKTMQIITKSTDDYPILVFDAEKWQKIYQPLNSNKSFRFRYAGDKPKDYVFGLDLLENQYKWNVKQIEKKKAEAKKNDEQLSKEELDPRINNVIIGSGDRDSINIMSMDFFVVWLNSETAILSYKVKKRLFEICKNVHYCGDIDDTGERETIALAKKYIDIKIIWLPQKLKEYKYRGKPRKDVKDFMDVYYNAKTPTTVVSMFKKMVFNALPCRFWRQVKNKKGYEISNHALIRFLYYHGFRRYKLPNSKKNEYVFIHLKDNVFKEVDLTQIRNFPIEWLDEKLYPIPLIDFMHRCAQLNEDKLRRLPEYIPNFQYSSEKYQYFFFRNKIWKVTANDIEQISYGASDVDVQYDKIIQKDVLVQTNSKKKHFRIFKNEAGKLDIEILRQDSEILNLMINTSRIHWRETGDKPFQEQILELKRRYPSDDLSKEIEEIIAKMQDHRKKYQFQITEPGLTDQQNYEQRVCLMNKLFSFGFMVYGFKDASTAFAPFCMDNKISESSNDSNGGSGKSLLFAVALQEALGFENVEEIDGSKPEISKDRFIFDNVTKETSAVVINDASSYFPMRMLYNPITNGFVSEVKGLSKTKISYQESPKMCVLSNFGMYGAEDSTSTTRRFLTVPFSDYYHYRSKNDLDKWEPKDDFEGQLFYSFDDGQWSTFFNLVAECCQFAMSSDPVEAISENITKRNLQQTMGTFQVWADQYFSLDKLDTSIPISEIKDTYSRENNKITSQKFLKKLEAWANFKGFEYNPKEFQSKDGYIRKTIDGETKTMIYIKTPKSYKEQVKANESIKTNESEIYGNDDDDDFDPTKDLS